MLKIKGDIDLKELEKYNFHQSNIMGQINYIFSSKDELTYITVEGKTRELFIQYSVKEWNIYKISEETLNTLYLLIKKGLIEDESTKDKKPIKQKKTKKKEEV